MVRFTIRKQESSVVSSRAFGTSRCEILRQVCGVVQMFLKHHHELSRTSRFYPKSHKI